MSELIRLVEHRLFQRLIVGVILLNAVVLGLLTNHDLPPQIYKTLSFVDIACLTVFCIEIGLKLIADPRHFFKDGWNIFDTIVVGLALIPASGPLSALRALRVLRLLRLVRMVPSMRRVINGMFAALPGGASVAAVLLLLYYVGAVVGTTLFGQSVPQHFGSLAITFFTLFKMMTLEGWPDIAAEVLPLHPHAWIFFVTFIIFTTFTTLNLLFGIIVDAMEQAKEEEVRQEMAEQGVQIAKESGEMRLAQMEIELHQVRVLLEQMSRKDPS